MGIVLKRRDNAPIVKKIYGNITDILLKEQDLLKSLKFLETSLQDLVNGKYPLEDFIITKTLKSTYKDPSKIAHKVLADRMGDRDPGNKPMVNDRIPYVYIQLPPDSEIKLQGDRIEHPDYVREHDIKLDYRFYITNQIMVPICQLYALCVEQLTNYDFPDNYWAQMEEELHTHRIYGAVDSSDMKRKKKLMAMRMDIAENLLFDKVLSTLPVACKIKKPPAKNKNTTTNKNNKSSETRVPEIHQNVIINDNTLILTIAVDHNKPAKKYDAIAKLKTKTQDEYVVLSKSYPISVAKNKPTDAVSTKTKAVSKMVVETLTKIKDKLNFKTPDSFPNSSSSPNSFESEASTSTLPSIIIKTDPVFVKYWNTNHQKINEITDKYLGALDPKDNDIGVIQEQIELSDLLVSAQYLRNMAFQILSNK